MGPDCRALRRPLVAAALAVASALAAPCLPSVRGQESIQQNAERLQKLSPEEKEDLRRKKVRYDALLPAEKERLRELHVLITADPKAQELSETAKRYNRWLATLEPAQRSDVLDEKDPQKRIAKIKKLMQAQEERRFKEFVSGFAENLPPADQDAIYKWFGDFVVRHEDSIRRHMPSFVRERLVDADETVRRRELMRSWSFQYPRRESETPVPQAKDVDKLVASLSAEAAKLFTAPEQRQGRVILFMQAAGQSLSVPQVTREELKKFYEGMKSDDPRRQRLERIDNADDLIAELRRMWITERFRERGPGGRPSSGQSGSRSDGRPRPGDDDKSKRLPPPNSANPDADKPDVGKPSSLPAATSPAEPADKK